MLRAICLRICIFTVSSHTLQTWVYSYPSKHVALGPRIEHPEPPDQTTSLLTGLQLQPVFQKGRGFCCLPAVNVLTNLSDSHRAIIVTGVYRRAATRGVEARMCGGSCSAACQQKVGPPAIMHYTCWHYRSTMLHLHSHIAVILKHVDIQCLHSTHPHDLHQECVVCLACKVMPRQGMYIKCVSQASMAAKQS